MLLKGVSKCVVEIQETGSAYFDRAIFFVKPDFFDTDEKKLHAHAQSLAESAGSPPPNVPLHKKRLHPLLAALLGALGGAIATGFTAWCL